MTAQYKFKQQDDVTEEAGMIQNQPVMLTGSNVDDPYDCPLFSLRYMYG